MLCAVADGNWLIWTGKQLQTITQFDEEILLNERAILACNQEDWDTLDLWIKICKTEKPTSSCQKGSERKLMDRCFSN